MLFVSYGSRVHRVPVDGYRRRGHLIRRVAYCNLIGYSEYSAHARLSKLDFKLLNFPV